MGGKVRFNEVNEEWFEMILKVDDEFVSSGIGMEMGE